MRALQKIAPRVGFGPRASFRRLGRVANESSAITGDEKLSFDRVESPSFYGSSEVMMGQSCWPEVLLAAKTVLSRPGTRLLVVSDFDHTLSDFRSEQCHELVGFNALYGEQFLAEFRAIFHTRQALDGWWRAAHNCIVEKSGLTRQMLEDRLNGSNVGVREGLQQLVALLRAEQVPLLVVSAGIRDVITHTLLRHQVDSRSDHLFHIDANYITFASCGRIASILPESPVHADSKHLVASRAPHLFPFSTQARKPEYPVDATNIGADGVDGVDTVALLLGDRVQDFDVLKHHPNILSLRMGFARDRTGERTQALLMEALCDAVCVGEQHGLHAVRLLVEDLLQARSLQGAGHRVQDGASIIPRG